MTQIIQYIIPPLIAAGAMVIVQCIVSNKQQRIQDIKNEYVIKEIKEDIRRLEEKQDKHNSLIERTIILERDMKTMWNRVEECKERINKIEHDQ